MLVIGREEWEAGKIAGTYAKCPQCYRKRKIRYGKERRRDGTWEDSTAIGFIKCGGNSYLVTIHGRIIPLPPIHGKGHPPKEAPNEG